MDLLDRLWAAWIAFRAPDSFVVVTEFHEFGWRITHRAATYDQAADWLRNHPGDGERILAYGEWRRRVLALWDTDVPWRRALALERKASIGMDDLAVRRLRAASRVTL